MRRLMFGVALAMVAVATQAAHAQSAAVDSALVRVENLRTPRLSPDGRRVVFTRVVAGKAHVALVDVSGGAPRTLAEGSGAEWSPKGGDVAYRSADGTRLLVRPVDGDGAERVLTTGTAIGALRWSPDGRQIAFVMAAAEAETFRGPTLQLHVVPSAGGAVQRVIPTGFRIAGRDTGNPYPVSFDWLDAGTLVVAGRDSLVAGDYFTSQIYRVSAGGGELRRLTTQPGFWHSPVVAPDGKSVAYLGFPQTSASYRAQDLRVMQPDGSRDRLLSVGFDRDPIAVRWSDKTTLWFSAQDRATVNTFTISTRSGRVKPASNGAHRMLLGDVNGDRGIGVAIRSTLSRPDEVVRFPLAKPWELLPVTATNAALVDALPAGESEEIEYRANDGTLIHGWVSRPVIYDPAQRVPLVVMLHDGPHGMHDAGFDPRIARLTNAGFAVFRPNVRESTGYGTDHGNRLTTFPDADVGDVIAGVDELIRVGLVDSIKVVLRGCGSGAVIALAALERTTRFAGAILECPWDFLAGRELGVHEGTTFMMPFRADPVEWLVTSPLRDVAQIRTPTLFLVESSPALAPADQRAAFHRELVLRRIPTTWAVMDDDGPWSWVETERRVMGWMRALR
ncbi:MAG: S9 family peptidase [Gemmatimonadales bacterium]|nr:S9 family peptidase [Gemmatimonadales bacterium]